MKNPFEDIEYTSKIPDTYKDLVSSLLTALELFQSNEMSTDVDSTANLVVQYDELIRCFAVLFDTSCDDEFMKYVSTQKLTRLKWIETINECKRLKIKLDSAVKDVSVLDSKLISARRWLDAERQNRKRAESERNAYVNQLEQVRRVLLNDPSYKLPDETKEKLLFLNKPSEANNSRRNPPQDRLNTIGEGESLSCPSDISITRSDNDVDDMKIFSILKKHRLSCESDRIAKKHRSVEDPISLDSPAILLRANSVNRGEDDDTYSAVDQINSRPHNFIQKKFYMQESCLFCCKKIGFGRLVRKCLCCDAVVHSECEEKVPLPCVPSGTPTKKGAVGNISDFSPTMGPMIPPIIVYCVMEIERRGLTAEGLYRVSGTEAIVRTLREKFAKGKGAQNLADVDIHSVCSCMKDFLRSLHDPLIPRYLWSRFAAAVSSGRDKDLELRTAVEALPPANRDTLAFLALHLQKVAGSERCKMSTRSLATVFGPTVVGFCSKEHLSAVAEARTANVVMEELLCMPAAFWNAVISRRPDDGHLRPPLSRTSSSDSLVRKGSRKLLASISTPLSRKKFFNTSVTSEDS